MPKSRNWSRQIVNPYGNGTSLITVETFSQTSDVSPRVNGKLRLRTNAFSQATRKNTKLTSYRSKNGPFVYPATLGELADASDPAIVRARTLADNQAYARFNGKLRKGGASLGVSIASWKQSRDMIIDRSRKLAKGVEALHARLLTTKSSRRRQSIASSFLEYEFGWMPLMQDIYATLQTACQQAIPPTSVGGIGSRSFTTGAQGVYTGWNCSGSVKTHVGCLVYVSNPNLWLANRLGLINPATVIWDLIPWSFVANMFLNVNAVVSSFTDFVGLTFSNIGTTRNVRWSGHSWAKSTYPPTHPFYSQGETAWEGRTKGRQVGVIPTPVLTYKLPNLDWELALIASSLLAQKTRGVSKLLSL